MREPYSSQEPEVRADITERGSDMDSVLLVLITVDWGRERGRGDGISKDTLGSNVYHGSKW